MPKLADLNQVSWSNETRDINPNGIRPKFTCTENGKHLLNYLAPLELYLEQKPYHCRLPLIDGLKRSNLAMQSYPVTIEDISGKEDNFTLERSGFQFLKFPVEISSWSDSVVVTEYIPAISSWLKEYFQSERALVYSYNVSAKSQSSPNIGANAD